MMEIAETSIDDSTDEPGWLGRVLRSFLHITDEASLHDGDSRVCVPE